MNGKSDWGGWGNVPDDRDIQPFSRINLDRAPGLAKKKHHFVSVTYMKGFTGSDGRLWRYLAEKADEPQRVAPSSFGYQKFYYSQELPDGTRDDHSFENIWNAVETVWAKTACGAASGRSSLAISLNLLGMAALMKTRVPAARERNALLMATKMRAEVQAAHKHGILPTEYDRYADELDTVPVGVNPQKTLDMMRREFKEFGDLCFRLGFEVLHNRTAIPFIASDNPVCIYDPKKAAHARRPYDFEDEIELIFPIDAWTLMRGSNRLKPVNRVGRHRSMSSASSVRRINRTIAQFSYRFIIALDRSSDDLAFQYTHRVPTVEIDVRRKTPKEIQIVWNHAFGPIPQLSQLIDSPERAARLEARMTAAPDGDEPLTATQS